MPIVRINTRFGSISFEYESEDQLQESIDQVISASDFIESQVGHLLPRTQRKPKPGFEMAYRFTPDGTVELLHYPPESVRATALALFAYHPDMVSASDLETVTGIDDIVAKALGQTKNKKYFRKSDDFYGLSADGIKYIHEVIAPTLPEPSMPEDEKEE